MVSVNSVNPAARLQILAGLSVSNPSNDVSVARIKLIEFSDAGRQQRSRVKGAYRGCIDHA